VASDTGSVLPDFQDTGFLIFWETSYICGCSFEISMQDTNQQVDEHCEAKKSS